MAALGDLSPLTVFIASEPGMAERMLSEHRDDGTGRGTVCTDGAQHGHRIWHCTIHHHALQAHRLAAFRAAR